MCVVTDEQMLLFRERPHARRVVIKLSLGRKRHVLLKPV